MTNKTTLLFDLGGVIIPWVGIDALMQKTHLKRSDVLKTLSDSDIFNAYEAGQCSDIEFLSEMVALFDYPMEPTEFSALWNSWVKPPFPGTLDALKGLKKTYTLACLSNTNTLHWTHLKTMIDLDEIFDYCFASHLIEVAKPKKESFIIPLETMNIKTDDLIFFDDTTENIEAANKLGIESYLVDRDVGVLPTLNEVLKTSR